MSEKYPGAASYYRAKVQRAMVRGMLGRLARWHPLEYPRPGYSIVVGCPGNMMPVLRANLTLLTRQETQGLREAIVVIGTRATDRLLAAQANLQLEFPTIPLRFAYLTRIQERVLASLRSPWCRSWLHWCIGTAMSETRYILLHDLDAMLMKPTLLRERYEAIRQRRDEYLGVRYYYGNGITPEDGLAVTFELMFDAAFVRQRFSPVDLFNRVGRCDGRRVEYDTFLDVQRRAGRGSILLLAGEDMVHPSQLFCQYARLCQEREYQAPERNNLLLLPYFLHVGGDANVLASHHAALEAARDDRVRFFGRMMNISRLSLAHVEWLAEQARRVERALVGHERAEVRAYFETLRRLVLRREAPKRAVAA